MAFTVAPLHNLNLPVRSRVPFGGGFFLRDVPDWLTNDTGTLERLSWQHRQGVKEAGHALVAEYDAPSIGEPDPHWTGNGPRSIQAAKTECVILANLALWMIQPSTVCFTNVFHALSGIIPGRAERQPTIQRTETDTPLLCHPRDVDNPVEAKHVIKAAELHKVFCEVRRKNPVWEALRAFWAALTLGSADRRYPFFWLGLEALFGADDNNGEIGYKLAQRIAFFIAETPEAARILFRTVKTCYNTRSKILHGRWKDDPKIDEVMAETEAIVRTATRYIAKDPQMMETFSSKGRDRFLEDMVFAGVKPLR